MCAVILHLRAKPNSRQNLLVVAADGSLTVRLKAPAHDGKANAGLLAYLADVFGVSKSSVELLAGHTAPFKKVQVAGVDAAALPMILARYREVV